MSTVSYLQEIRQTLQNRIKLQKLRHPLVAIQQVVAHLEGLSSRRDGAEAFAQQWLQDVNLLYLLEVAEVLARRLERPVLAREIAGRVSGQARKQARLAASDRTALSTSALKLAAAVLDDVPPAVLAVEELARTAAVGGGVGGLVCDLLRDLYEELLALEWLPAADGESAGQIKRTNARRRKLGAYYTPLPVARAMAERVLTPVLAGCANRRAVLDLRVVDPMMGPGVFLQAAGELLVAHAAALPGGGDAAGALWPRVAADCLYGVDLDGDAAQVGRIGLAFLSGATVAAIHCVAGNSLVGSVREEVAVAARVEKQLAALRAEQLPMRANAPAASELPGPWMQFARAFPGVFGGAREGRRGWNGVRLTGGFDVLLSNPPYVSYYSRDSVKKNAESLEEAFFNRAGILDRELPADLRGRTNLFLLALFAGEQLLCREAASDRVAGRAGWLLPDTFLSNESYEGWRRWFLESRRLEAVEWIRADLFGEPSLGSAGVYFGRAENDQVTVELVAPVAAGEIAVAQAKRRGRPRKAAISAAAVANATAAAPPPELARTGVGETFTIGEISGFPHLVIPTMARATRQLVARIEAASVPVTSWMEVRDGVNPGPRDFRDRVVLDRPDPADSTVRPLIVGGDIEPFRLNPVGKWIRHNPALLTPAIKKQGASFRAAELFAGPKIVSRQTASHPIAALDLERRSAINSVHIMIPNDRLGLDTQPHQSLLLVLGCLNVAAMSWYYQQRWMENRRVFPQVHISSLRQLPIPAVFREAAAAAQVAACTGEAVLAICPAPAQAAWQKWVQAAVPAAGPAGAPAAPPRAKLDRLVLDAWQITPAEWRARAA